MSNNKEVELTDEPNSQKSEEKSGGGCSCAVVIILIVILAIFLILFIVFLVLFCVGSSSSHPAHEVADYKYVSAAKKVSSKIINLSELESDIVITSSGRYTLSGMSNYSVFVDCDSSVTLVLNDAQIGSNKTAAIASLGSGSLTISVIETSSDSGNWLYSGCFGDYNGAIVSYGKLTIEGEGALSIQTANGASGIVSKGKEIIIKNRINIRSNAAGIVASRDGITFESGEVYIEGSSGILSSGEVSIEGGLVSISASGTSIYSTSSITVSDGYLYSSSSQFPHSDDWISITGGVVCMDSIYNDEEPGYYNKLTVSGGYLLLRSNSEFHFSNNQSDEEYFSLYYTSSTPLLYLYQQSILSSTAIYNNENEPLLAFNTQSYRYIVVSAPSLLKDYTYSFYSDYSCNSHYFYDEESLQNYGSPTKYPRYVIGSEQPFNIYTVKEGVNYLTLSTYY